MKISNAGRVVFPEDGITKGDVVGYYQEISARILPFVSGRALTVERYPKGIAEKGFMQKNAPDHLSSDLVSRHEVPKEGGTTVYPVIDRVESILAFANLGVITFHVPPAKVSDTNHPDWAIWDLDPPESGSPSAREAALALRETLCAFGVETGLMTTGSSGYHLRCPLIGSTSAGDVARTTRGLSALAAHARPSLMTLAFKKADRGGRVFVDWLRNAPYSTSVAPWSLRPRAGAPVAAPLAWDEIDAVGPDDVRMGDVASRATTDPWGHLRPMDLKRLASTVDDALKDAGIVLEPFDRFRS